jgi:predicted RNA-binding Zn-ribbon protein involved in translation (DUF1610 family)
MLVTVSPSHPAPDLPVCPLCGLAVRVAGAGTTHWHECPDCGPVDPVTARARQIYSEWNGDDPEG